MNFASSKKFVSKDIVKTAAEPLSDGQGMTEQFHLGDNYPDPFASVTTIPFRLACQSDVHIDLYDQQGVKILPVLAQRMDAGEQRLILSRASNISSLAAGDYVYELSVTNEHGTFRQSKLLTIK